MKKITLFFLLIVQITLAQPFWEKIKTPTDFNLLRIYYLDSLHCWVAGDSGVIMFSSDKGTTWQFQNSGVSNYIEDIYFLNKDLGWAVTFEIENFNIRSKILRTTNGGNQWESSNYRHQNIILTTIFFNDSLNGWIGGIPFALGYSNDGGLNWNEANVDTGVFSNFPLSKIRFSKPELGFAVGGAIDVAGVVWRTSDSGQLWKAFGIAPDRFDDFVYLDSSNVLALSADIERYFPIGILKFNLETSFWTYVETEKFGRVTSLSKRKPNEIWGTLGCDTSFIVSTDKAESWDFIPTNDSICIHSISFADSLNGIATADSGYIFRYIPQQPVIVIDQSEILPDKFVLYQNFPNPFNPNTTISWQNANAGYNTLKVFDILGNEVAILIDEYKSTGFHTVEFKSEHLPSGIYFYQIKAGDYIFTKKMILLK